MSSIRKWFRRQGLLKRAVIRDLGLQGLRALAHRFDFRENIRQVRFQHPAAIRYRRVPGAT
jgi:hypothetical protein